jgi:hypothetical protein
MVKTIGKNNFKSKNMNETVEKLIDSYYEDSLELPDNKLLTIKRELNHRSSGRQAIHILLDDLDTGTKIDLGTYFDARWKFSLPMNERIFWKYVKSNWNNFKSLFNKMRGSIPTSYQLQFKKLNVSDQIAYNELSIIYNS